MDKAIFGAGCFWQVEAAFRELPGVKEVTSGYSGGTLPEPTYEAVCSNTTGHAEVVEVEYDPAEIDYEQLLDKFFELHDPTQLNRQGPDVGEQYRSVIFFESPEQEAAAHAAIERHAGDYKRPIVTQVLPASEFYRAEDYHQRYFERRGLLGRLLRH